LTAGDRAGLAGVRSAVASGCAAGRGAGCGARWPQRPRGRRSWAGGRPRWVVVVVPAARGGRARKGQWACRRGWACGPGAARAGGGRSQLATGSAVTWGNGWWACQDLNLGPHPYQQNTGNRCADRRSCRWRSTVEAEVMWSHRVQLCAVVLHRILRFIAEHWPVTGSWTLSGRQNVGGGGPPNGTAAPTLPRGPPRLPHTPLAGSPLPGRAP
jgi:hypothetical protein